MSSESSLQEYLKNIALEDQTRKDEQDASEDVRGAAQAKESTIRQFDPEPPMDIPDVRADDLMALLYAEIRRTGVAGHHIDSMNTFYKVGINQIITKLFRAEVSRMKNERDKTTEDKDIEYISFSVEFTKTHLKKPSTHHHHTRDSQILTPATARRDNQTYSANLSIDANITATAYYYNKKVVERTDTITDLHIAKIPVMVRTDLCHTANVDIEALLNMHEDPTDPGGYFVIHGTEWCIDNLENIQYNSPQIYRSMIKNEIARADIISKPGDNYENSFRFLLKYMRDGSLIVEFQYNKNERLYIPFMFIYRIFGMTRDDDIIETITYGSENQDHVTQYILDIVSKAFRVIDKKEWDPRIERDPDAILEAISRKVKPFVQNNNYKKDINATKYMIQDALQMMDTKIFPHIGMDPASRIKKLRFFGHLINKLIRVEYGVMEPSDRDSLKNKRIHTAGISLAKTFKTQFNFSIVLEIKKYLIKEFKANTFSSINLAEAVKQAIKQHDLERALEQSITTGNKTIVIKKNEVSNRVSSQMLYRKNDNNVKSTLRTVNSTNSSAAKQNERADLMRRVHNSFVGYVCVSKSADTGERVGTSKEMAISASILEASISDHLKYILEDDPRIITDAEIIHPREIRLRNLDKVFVNGDPRGYCENGAELARYYRMARRNSHLINPFTTITWELETNEVHFWVDVGRMTRPLIIVYNNIEEYMAAFRIQMDPKASADAKKKAAAVKFRQWTRLTPEHINGLQSNQLSMEDLRRERIIEYISPEEQLNTFIAINIDELRERQNDILYQYTHVDIEQSILGITALINAKANHSGSVRASYATNQSKQRCGWFVMSWPYMIEKNTFLQYCCERPITDTFADTISGPNGQNCLVAFQIYSGYNCEDSAIFNKDSIDRGLFNGSSFTYEKTELEKGESFEVIDSKTTMDRGKGVYEYIGGNGLVIPSSVVEKNHVLISKVGRIPKAVGDKNQVDRSVIYKGDEPAIVVQSFTYRNNEETLCAKVQLRYPRKLRVGDKVASRSGNKNITAVKLRAPDMPYSEDGLIPDLIVNPHGVPTRMCIGQILETVLAEYAVSKGGVIDSTVFKKHDLHGMIEHLKSVGFEYGGHRRLYNGMTGEPIDTLIFMGFNYYNRLQKFVADESYSVNTGPVSALAHQPLDGKSNFGGLRLGEMEKDTLLAAGSARMFSEKFYTDCDGIRLAICRGCGERAIVNHEKGIYKCKLCGDGADIAEVESSWVANILFNELRGMSVGVRLNLEPYIFDEVTE